MSDIFISYSRDDRVRIERLADCLQAQGWDVWWDPVIPVGQSYRKVIGKALDDARCVVVAWSRTSVDSDWVLAEAGAGKDRNILVPISIDGTKPLLDFAQIQTADFSSWTSDCTAPEFQQLLEGITHIIDKPAGDNRQALPPEAVSKPRPKRALIVGAGTILVAAAVAVFVWFEIDPKALEKSIMYGNRTMMLVPAGPFEMGANLEEGGRPESQPRRTVYLDAFYMDKFEVSNAEFALFRKHHSEHELVAHLRECPYVSETAVCGVKWSSANAFCAWQDKVLPTEAQWEKAARGTDSRAFPWGDKTPTSTSSQANFLYDELGKTLKINANKEGQSPYEIYNLSGNVSEWVADWYSEDFYTTAPERNPVNLNSDGAPGRGMRGGSFGDRPANAKVFARSWEDPERPRDFVGFRCAISADKINQ